MHPSALPFRRAAGSAQRRRRSLWLAACCVLTLAGSAGALLGARAVARSDAAKARLAFHLTATDIAATLQQAIQQEEDLVVSASAFVAAGRHVDAGAFNRWVETVHAMRRNPELLYIGLLEQVPAARLRAFARRIERHPVVPHAAAPRQPFTVLPSGHRPYYCFAVAALVRNFAAVLPEGLDYCAMTTLLAAGRESGAASYAPFSMAGTTLLGVQAPVYTGGPVPAGPAQRRRAFLGWVGELLDPKLVLERALKTHPQTAVTFRYASGSSQIVFHRGSEPRQAQSATMALPGGWSVRAAAAAPASGVLGDPRALPLLIGGVLLSVLLALVVSLLGLGRTRALREAREKGLELSHRALHDALTGLPNRALVLDRAEQTLARTARQATVLTGALFIDVDNFKHVNDSLGHVAGDELLQVVARRLLASVRGQDTVGRLGGDEFVVLVEAEAHESIVGVLADRLVDALREPVELTGGRTVTVTVSVGVAVGRYSSPDALLRDADLALYAAKAAGRDRYSLFDASMQDDVEGRVALELDLASALSGEQFFLLYQPIFDVERGRIEGAEALLRWRHPVRGIVAPDAFIPLAEESGLIVPIGQWVLEQACEQAAAWHAAGREIGVSVNVSAHQLGRQDFVEHVHSALQRSGLAPAALMLEVTETTLMRDVSSACEHLEEIKALGVRVAIDDFGTGYASLSQLQRLPADILKVDRSFVAALEQGAQSHDLLQAILGVGRSLSLKVIAEGIETEEQLETVRAMGCEMVQGYLLGRPGPAEVVEGLIARPAPATAAATLV
ncbi:MAG: bifunctional diguanylate cyclase/phosphodiesterase [Solirubrobacteraceae bacterium]